MSDSSGEPSPPPASCSAALAELYGEDRREHADVPPVGTPEYRAVRERDRRRRVRAANLLDSLEAAGAASSEDLYHAAWLFNHGDQPAEARRAHELAREAAERGHRPARWLAATAYDRWCMYEGRPQRYGTQFVPDGVRHRLWDVDPATTDEERAAWDVPPLAEQLRRADELTRNEPQPPMDEAPAWLKDAIDRWASEGTEEQSLRRAGGLPFIDEHMVRIAAPRGVAWTALEKYVAALLRRTEDGLLKRLLGTEPRAGFEIAERTPPACLTLVGRHRFARYQLAFDLTDPADGTTHLRATTHAEFPGLRGRAYRTLVIGTRAHVVATTRILRSIRRRALRSLVGVPLAVCALLGLDAHSASAEVPTWIAPEPSDPSGRPLWVSVEAALATDGSLRSELFSPEFVAAIDQLNKQAEERQRTAQSEGYELAAGSAPVVPYDCDQSGPSRGQEPAELYANSRLILAGKVTHSRQGFFRETVGQLLEVAVDETIKAPAGAQSRRSFLLFLREALVSPGLRRFCIDGASRRPPAIGARVLLLLDVDPADAPGGVVVPLDNDLFLERSKGRLSAPKDFPAEGLSFEALLRGLREAR